MMPAGPDARRDRWPDVPGGTVAHQLGDGLTVLRFDLGEAGTPPADLLDAASLARAARLTQPREGRRLLAAHAILRSVLADALGRPAHALHLIAGAHGKPQLPTAALHFNMSRSGDHLLIALSRSGEVGADIERLRPLPQPADLALASLTARELARWRATAPYERDACLLRYWTRKEACLKAAGVGLGLAPARIEVLDDDAPCALTLRTLNRDWRLTLESLTMPAGLVAAVAMHAQPSGADGGVTPPTR
jgi:4'-phosphopantetheinyl transferase